MWVRSAIWSFDDCKREQYAQLKAERVGVQRLSNGGCILIQRLVAGAASIARRTLRQAHAALGLRIVNRCGQHGRGVDSIPV